METQPTEAVAMPRFSEESLLFRTTDLEEARSRVAQVFCDHQIRTLARGDLLQAEMYYRSLRGCGIGRLRYGAGVEIDPGVLEDFVLVQIPMRGTEIIEHGTQTISSNTRIGSVLSPTKSVRIRHSADTDKLTIRIDRSDIERHCRQLLGRDLREPLEFSPSMALDDPGLATWLRLVGWLSSETTHSGSSNGTLLDAPLFAAQVSQLLAITLLLSQPNNYSDRLKERQPSIAPFFVRRVEQYIDENAHEPLTVTDLAEYAGVSTRSLFAGFRKYRQSTPMQYLKRTRMERVREDLLVASARTQTVTNIATRWGFTHLGHFTVDYKQRFGESPSATLQRC